jgi:hypothetical protein
VKASVFFLPLVLALVVLIAVLVWTPAGEPSPTDTGTGPEPVPTPTTTVEVERRFQGRTARMWHGIAAAYRRKLLIRWRPTVEYAYRLASVTFGVPYSQLHAVGGCESTHYPFARNGRYRGLFQEGPMFESGPYGRAGFSVWDPVANALTAAGVVAGQGWRQWECKP